MAGMSPLWQARRSSLADRLVGRVVKSGDEFRWSSPLRLGGVPVAREPQLRLSHRPKARTDEPPQAIRAGLHPSSSLPQLSAGRYRPCQTRSPRGGSTVRLACPDAVGEVPFPDSPPRVQSNCPPVACTVRTVVSDGPASLSRRVVAGSLPLSRRGRVTSRLLTAWFLSLASRLLDGPAMRFRNLKPEGSTPVSLWHVLPALASESPVVFGYSTATRTVRPPATGVSPAGVDRSSAGSVRFRDRPGPVPLTRHLTPLRRDGLRSPTLAGKFGLRHEVLRPSRRLPVAPGMIDWHARHSRRPTRARVVAVSGDSRLAIVCWQPVCQ